jgi:hypothetical protein
MFIEENVKQPDPLNKVVQRSIKSASESYATDVCYKRKEERNQAERIRQFKRPFAIRTRQKSNP